MQGLNPKEVPGLSMIIPDPKLPEDVVFQISLSPTSISPEFEEFETTQPEALLMTPFTTNI